MAFLEIFTIDCEGEKSKNHNWLVNMGSISIRYQVM